MAWSLYDDAAFSHRIARCSRSNGIRTPGASCTASLPAGTNPFLRVDAVGPQSGYPGSIIIAGNDLHLAVESLTP